MTQEQDNSEQTQPKTPRQSATSRKTTRRAVPTEGDEAATAVTRASKTLETPQSGDAPKKPRRRTAKAASVAGETAPDLTTAASDGVSAQTTETTETTETAEAAGTEAPKAPVRRTRVAKKATDPVAATPPVTSEQTAAPAESAVTAEFSGAEDAPKKPRRRTTRSAKTDLPPTEGAVDTAADIAVGAAVDAAVDIAVNAAASAVGEAALLEAVSAPKLPADSSTGEDAKPARPRRTRKRVEPEAAPASAPLAPVESAGSEPMTAEAAGEEQVGNERSAAESAPVPSPSVEAEAPAQPVYADDGVVTHILPLPTEQEDRNRRRRPRRRSRKPGGQPDAGFIGPMPEVSLYDIIQPPLNGTPDDNGEMPHAKRHRSRRKRKPGGSPQPFQPEAFADVYPSSVLGVDDHFTFSDDFDEIEDDGPQPALPGQPSLALPPAALEDEDLEALDEAVNGNRVNAPDPGRSQGRGRKSGRPEAVRPAKTPRPAEAKAQSPDEDDTPEIPTGKRVLYMSVVPEEQVEVVITDNGQVTEYFVEMAHQAKIRGNIYKGVINNVDTNLQAAFVNFGSGKNGFLQIDEVHPEYWLTPHDAGRGPKYPPIQKVLKVGQEVLVQVVKEPAGSKGAFLTTWVSLAGRFLVLTPGQEQIGVSRKVEDPEERSRLKELLAGIDPGEDMGVIIRTASEGASKTSIQKDLQYLKRLWKDLRKRATTEKAPCLIYQEADLASRAVRDYMAEDIREIWVDDEATLESIRETTSLLFPRRQDMVKLHQDPRQTVWERFNLQRQLEEVTSREVILPSGGRLVFDQTEALMAIDINSGKTQGKSNFEAMVFRTNMEAAEAIARHLRLRDIGGQVVIDFIEMRDRNHCRDVEKTLRNAMRLDRARHDVGHMSSFGLLELVRQRTGTSAISISSEPCPYCRGTGVRRNMEWQALHALRDLQSKLVKNTPSDNGKNRKGDHAAKNGHAGNGGAFVYEAEPELGMYLLNKKRDRLLELESRFNTPIEISLKACMA